VAGQAGSTCLWGWGGGAFFLCAELTSQYWLGRGREGGTVGEEMEQCKNKGWVATGRLAGQGHLKSKSSPNQTAAFQIHVKFTQVWRKRAHGCVRGGHGRNNLPALHALAVWECMLWIRHKWPDGRGDGGENVRIGGGGKSRKRR